MSITDDIEQRLVSRFEDAEHLGVSMEGNHLSVTLAWRGFDGMMPVKRQQAVYALLNDYIASGEVHAVHMSLFSPAQWAKAKHFV